MVESYLAWNKTRNTGNVLCNRRFDGAYAPIRRVAGELGLKRWAPVRTNKEFNFQLDLFDEFFLRKIHFNI